MSPVGLRREFVTTTRGQLHVLTGGAGRPVVLLQNLPFSAYVYRPLMEILGERHACFGLDIMGYGDSDRRQGLWLVEDYARNLAEALDALGLSDVLLVTGHLTAMIGVELALIRPDLVSRLTIDGVSAASREEAAASLAAAKPVADWTAEPGPIADWWQTIHALLVKLNPGFDIAAADKEMVVRYFGMHLLTQMGPYPYDAAMRYDIRKKLLQVTKPVLLITSATDTQRGHHARNAALIRNGEVHDFEGINPIYMFDHPERAVDYARVLERFWAA